MHRDRQPSREGETDDDGLTAAMHCIVAARAHGGFLVPLPLPLPLEGMNDPLRRAIAVLALRQAGYQVRALSQQFCEVRMRAAALEYRLAGRRGAWGRRDPAAAALAERRQRYLATLAKLKRQICMGDVRAAKALHKARRDAMVIEEFEALGLTPRPLPERSRASVVALAIGCSARHVRAVVAKWRKKSGTG